MSSAQTAPSDSANTSADTRAWEALSKVVRKERAKLLLVGTGPGPAELADRTTVASPDELLAEDPRSDEQAPFAACLWHCDVADEIAEVDVARAIRLDSVLEEQEEEHEDESSHFVAATHRRVAEAIRRRLGERGLLVVVTQPCDTARVVAEALLAEHGFAIHDVDRLEDGTVLVARVDEYVLRPCRDEDVEPILELFVPSFHAERSVAHWRWKYEQNPWARRWISVAEAADGELAAHYAGFPVPFVFLHDDGRREDLRVCQIGDAMTAKGHRRAGLGPTSLLGRAIRHQYGRFGQTLAAFNYGFAAASNRKFHFRFPFVAAKWGGPAAFWRRRLEPMPGRPDLGAPGPAAGRARRLEPFGAVEKEQVRLDDRLDDRLEDQVFDDFFERVVGSYRVLVRRRSDWLRWRYAACPDSPRFFAVAVERRDGGLAGWGIFRRHHDPRFGERLAWVDALVDPQEASQTARELLRVALEQPEASGIQEIVAWFAPRPAWWIEVLVGLGFDRVQEPDDLGLMLRFLSRPDLRQPLRSWYYTWGDTDLA